MRELPAVPWSTISSTPHELGEGIRLIDGQLRWVDLLRGELHHADQPNAVGTEPWMTLAQPVGFVERTADGRLLAAAGIGVFELTGEGLAELGSTGLDPARHRVNDGTIAADGSVWFGTMVHDGSTPDGAIWRWDPESGHVRRMLDDIDIPNGPTSFDESRLLFADTARASILWIDTRTGETAPFAATEGGTPDGLHVDADRHVWSAVWGGSRLDVHAPSGELIGSVPLPVSQPTSAVITGGTDPHLVVTSATIGLAAPSPLDGHTISASLDLVLPHAHPASQRAGRHDARAV